MSKRKPTNLIYLQNFYDAELTTWCEDQINDDDIVYVLESEYEKLQSEIARLTQRVRELEDKLTFAINVDIEKSRELRALRDVSRWIPVNERLPKYDQRVFGVKNKQVIIGFVSGVTHWMPLPDVPQEGE